ncbi:ATP-binding protein [Marinobacter sp. KMM 10035]|uniref:sensor histidine kinase n=1 Tax=Marinobacter sp. KMM 10035 TaxID=3134034 RepID=UPI00397867FF
MFDRIQAPIPLMLSGAVASLILVAFATYIACQTPWLGLDLSYDESQQLPLIEVIHNPANNLHLQVGDHLTSMSVENSSDAFSLKGFRLHVEPPSHANYADHNALLEREEEVASLLKHEKVWVTTEAGNTTELTVLPERPIATLGYEFWLFNLFGLIAWNVSLAVWAIRPRETAARLLCASGAGFFFATLFNSIYLSREIALPQDLFLVLTRANHLGLAIMLFSLLALMAYYPRRISRPSPAIYLIPLFIFYQANETFQWIEWPLHTYYLPVLMLYLAGIVVAVYQWRMSAQVPLDRAALKWMLVSIFIIMGLGLAIYFLPLVLFGEAAFPQWAMVGTASLLYIGFAFGIVRYRLFDVDRWWLAIWAWFLAGLAIVVVDFALISAINIHPSAALAIAVIAVGWIYFPLRQIAWEKLHPDAPDPDDLLTSQVERIVQAMPPQRTDHSWMRLLIDAYKPANTNISSKKTESVSLYDNGAVMVVPLLLTVGAVHLTLPNHGRRLFSLKDRKHTEGLLVIAKRILAAHEGERIAVQQERERIVRDLHDNVGGHLLTLLRRAPSKEFEQPAHKALKALRESMRILDGNPLQDLTVCLQDMKAEVEEKLIDTNIALSWRQSLNDDSLEITMRQAININHILSEAVNNAVEHADSKHIQIRFEIDDKSLALTIVNDGATRINPETKLMRGRGLNNMSVRASELGGHFEFSIENGFATMLSAVPLNSR